MIIILIQLIVLTSIKHVNMFLRKHTTHIIVWGTCPGRQTISVAMISVHPFKSIHLHR